jgi:hypothetical protein
MKRPFSLFAIASLFVVSCSGNPGILGSPAFITVSGKLLTARKQPVAGAVVVISGRPAVTSDLDGAFTVAEVTTPYDLSIVDGPAKSIYVYKGLSRTDPVIRFNPSAYAHSAHLRGGFSGGSYPQGAGYETRVGLIAADRNVLGSMETAKTYAVNAAWNGPRTIAGTLHALQVRNLPTGPEYKGYGTQDLTVADGDYLTGQNIGLAAVDPSLVSGSVTPPSGYAVSSKAVRLGVGLPASILAVVNSSTESSFRLACPKVPGMSLELAVSASKSKVASVQTFRTGIAAGTSEINITLPQAAELVEPADRAVGINRATTFSWSAFAGGVHQVTFDGSTSGNPNYTVLTTDTSVTIPDGSLFDLGLPSAAEYKWSVVAFGGFPSSDAAASMAFLDWNLRARAGDYSFSSSDPRQITTAP